MKQLNVSIEEAVHTKAKAAAALQGVPLQSWVESLIRNATKNIKAGDPVKLREA